MIDIGQRLPTGSSSREGVEDRRPTPTSGDPVLSVVTLNPFRWHVGAVSRKSGYSRESSRVDESR